MLFEVVFWVGSIEEQDKKLKHLNFHRASRVVGGRLSVLVRVRDRAEWPAGDFAKYKPFRKITNHICNMGRRPVSPPASSPVHTTYSIRE